MRERVALDQRVFRCSPPLPCSAPCRPSPPASGTCRCRPPAGRASHMTCPLCSLIPQPLSPPVDSRTPRRCRPPERITQISFADFRATLARANALCARGGTGAYGAFRDLLDQSPKTHRRTGVSTRFWDFDQGIDDRVHGGPGPRRSRWPPTAGRRSAGSKARRSRRDAVRARRSRHDAVWVRRSRRDAVWVRRSRRRSRAFATIKGKGTRKRDPTTCIRP